jgi:hypothetical protein
MKFQKMIRMQMVLAGLGAALVLGSSAYAQQEMDPTTFDVNPGTPHVVSGGVARTAQSAAPANKVNSATVDSAALWNGQATQQEADLARLTLVDTMMVVIMMIGIGLIVLYAMAATRRERRLQISPESAPYTAATGAAAH